MSPSITEPISPIELSLPEQQELGYMPLRDDFERVSLIDFGWNLVLKCGSIIRSEESITSLWVSIFNGFRIHKLMT